MQSASFAQTFPCVPMCCWQPLGEADINDDTSQGRKLERGEVKDLHKGVPLSMTELGYTLRPFLPYSSATACQCPPWC